MIYKKTSITPSLQPILSFEMKYHRSKFDIRENMATLEKADMFTLKGDPTKVTPKIQVKFTNPLPIRFPNARLRWPCLVACTLVANSGTVVPNATIVDPITIEGTSSAKAM